MKKITVCAILVSLALVLAIVERGIPFELISPVPGIKIGLPNIITLFALFFLDLRSVFAIVILRCILVAILVGSFSSFAFSITGGIFALIIMIFLKKGYNNLFSMIGISIAGAAFHNIGQIIMACILLKSFSIFAYLPLLLLTSIATGLITGIIGEELVKRMSKIMHSIYQ